MGKVPIWPLTYNSNNHPPPLRQPCPHWGRGRMQFLCITKIPIQVIQHHRNRGALAARVEPPGVFMAIMPQGPMNKA